MTTVSVAIAIGVVATGVLIALHFRHRRGSSIQPLNERTEHEIGKELLRLGFRVVGGAAGSRNLVEYDGLSFRLRIVRERGEMFADVASWEAPGEWLQLDRVLEAAGSTVRLRVVGSLSRLGEALAMEHARLAEGLSASRFATTRAAVEKIGEAYMKRLSDGQVGD